MKLSLVRDALLKPLNTVIGVVGRKPTSPVLANILFSIKNNDLELVGSDSEIELLGSSKLFDESISDASITLPGRKLVDICRSLPEEASIELYQDKEAMILRSGKSRFRLATLPASHFPKIDTEVSELSFTMSQLDLRALLQRTSFTIAQQELRHYFNGLLWEIEPDKLTVVATDGHRLALSSVALTSGVQQKTRVILPRKTVLELLRLLENNDETVGITLSKRYVTVSGSDFTLVSKLLEGDFPDYQMVIPNHLDRVLILEKDLIKQALGRAAIFCSENGKGVRFQLSPNLLKISLNNPDQESAEEEIAVEFSKEPLDIGFNVTYLLDILNVVSDNQIKFSFGGSNSSMTIQEVNNPYNSLYVVMPVRL